MSITKATTAKKSKTSKKTSRKSNLIPWAKDPRTITSAQKKAWRERKRQAQKIMGLVLEYQNMTTGELKKHMEKNKDKLTVLEYTMMKYVTEGMKDKKIMLDMIDRHISKAPQQMELTGEDGGPITTKIIKIWS